MPGRHLFASSSRRSWTSQGVPGLSISPQVAKMTTEGYMCPYSTSGVWRALRSVRHGRWFKQHLAPTWVRTLTPGTYLATRGFEENATQIYFASSHSHYPYHYHLPAQLTTDPVLPGADRLDIKQLNPGLFKSRYQVGDRALCATWEAVYNCCSLRTPVSPRRPLLWLKTVLFLVTD